MKRIEIATILLSGIIEKERVFNIESDVSIALRYTDELIKQNEDFEEKLRIDTINKRSKRQLSLGVNIRTDVNPELL
jgi:hypothetical protein